MSPHTEIHDIFDKYESAPNKKELDKRLRELGSMIESKSRGDRQRKINDILSKGQDMTKSEIIFLMGNEIPKVRIRKALRISSNEFYDYLKKHRLTNVAKINAWDKEEIEIVRKALHEGETVTSTAMMLKGRTYNAVASLRSEIKRGIR